MPEPFSLAGHAWIPVVRSSGQRDRVCLRDIASPCLLRIASGRADIDIALTEFLIGLLAISLGTKGPSLWRRLYQAPPSPAALDEALAPFAEALVLDGDGVRFFQDKEKLAGKTTPVAALFIDAPAEHFVKPGGYRQLGRVGAALALLTLQTMAPAGGAGNRTGLRGGGPLTTLVVPPSPKDGATVSLWHWLWLNTPGDLKVDLDDVKIERVLPWLGPTHTSEKGTGVETTPVHVHPGQAFFGLPRRIRLCFEPNTERLPCDLTGEVDEVIVREYVQRPWGTNYVNWSKGHPLSPYYRQKPTDDDWLPTHLQSTQLGYRHWTGLCVANKETTRIPAGIVTEYREHRRHALKDCGTIEPRHLRHGGNLLICGYVLDKMKPLDFGEALMPLIIADDPKVEDDLPKIVAALVSGASDTATLLRGAVKLALYGDGAETKADSAQLHAVTVRFWAETTAGFYEALHSYADLTEDELPTKGGVLRDGWRKTLRRVALDIFDEAAPLDVLRIDRMGGREGQLKNPGVEARRNLSMAMKGYGKAGAALFAALQLVPPPQAKSKQKGTAHV